MILKIEKNAQAVEKTINNYVYRGLPFREAKDWVIVEFIPYDGQSRIFKKLRSMDEDYIEKCLLFMATKHIHVVAVECSDGTVIHPGILELFNQCTE